MLFQNKKHTMTEKDFLKLPRGTYIVVDVRSPMEYSLRHLGIAQNIPYTDILSGAHNLPFDKKIFCYCNYGNRGGRSAESLCTQGYEAYVLSGMELFSSDFIRQCSN